jgi:hypothetical protein
MQTPSVTIDVPVDVLENAGIVFVAEHGRLPESAGDWNRIKNSILSVLTVSSEIAAETKGAELAARIDKAKNSAQVRKNIAQATLEAGNAERERRASLDRKKGSKKSAPNVDEALGLK